MRVAANAGANPGRDHRMVPAESQVCPNALHEHGIDPGTIPTFALTNLGGVVALVLAQHDGFAYVKP